MSIRIRNLLFVGVITALAVACSEEPQSEGNDKASSAAGNNEWMADELLKQMQALREENAQMRKKLAEISERLDELDKQAPADEAGEKQDPEPDKTLHFEPEHALGAESAQVAIIEFTDYQCPYCGKHHSRAFPEIREKLIDTGKVRYSVRHFPLSFHGKAEGAAVAATCAQRQGHFWEMHQALFKNQGQLGEDFYEKQSTEMGLETDQFQRCLADPSARDAVNSDLLYGQKVGVSGTPRFYVGRIEGGRVKAFQEISGAQSYGVFKAAVSRLLN